MNIMNKLVDMTQMPPEKAREKIGKIIFTGQATDKFEAASREAFLDSIMYFMGEKGNFAAVI